MTQVGLHILAQGGGGGGAIDSPLVLSLALNGLLAVVLMLARRGNHQADSVADARHALLVAMIQGVGTKVDDSNRRIEQVERDLRRMGDQHAQHAIEIERIKGRIALGGEA